MGVWARAIFHEEVREEEGGGKIKIKASLRRVL